MRVTETKIAEGKRVAIEAAHAKSIAEERVAIETAAAAMEAEEWVPFVARQPADIP